MTYRMYVDEVGSPILGSVEATSPSRYLSLTGAILSLDSARDLLHPKFEDLKIRYFNHHPDKDPVVFHRKEMINKNHPFHALKDPELCSKFNIELLKLMVEFDFKVITVTIDQWEHFNTYGSWAFHPYHYCLTVLLERYVRWLEGRGAKGDVMAEARGKKEDRALSDAFESILTFGTASLRSVQFGARLTSKSLKLKTKKNNIAGLQLADLVAHPACRGMKLLREHAAIPDDFGGKIWQLLEARKFRRADWHPYKVEGYGRKWLP